MAWPSYAEVIAQGFGPGADGNVERTPFDDGMIRQERRYPAALKTLRVTALLDAGRLADFRTWADASAHAWFDFPTPLAAGNARARVRGGAGGIDYELQAERRGKVQWAATMTLEGTDL